MSGSKISVRVKNAFINARKSNMGLTGWKGERVRAGDVTIAKNYLTANEIEGLNRIVTMYLDYADDQAKRHQQIFMRDWRNKLDAFLQFNERDILNNSGKVSIRTLRTSLHFLSMRNLIKSS